jgi:hypothetical protein
LPDSILDRKAETMSLPFSMIGILTENYHPDLIKRSQIKGIEDIRSFRIDHMSCLFLLEKNFLDMGKIGLSKFLS